jgi:hypothetical protein
MKKRILPVALVLCSLSLVLVISCSSGSSGSSGSSYKAPSITVSDVSSLSSGATSTPADATAAKTLYTDAIGAFSTAMSSELSSSLSTSSIMRKGMKTTTKTGPTTITWKGALGSGTVDMTGSYTTTETSIDENTTPVVGKTYDAGATMSYSMAGTVTGATVTKGGHTYTINGKLDMADDFSYTVSVKVTAVTPVAYSASFSLDLGLSYGTAFTVKREDGLGAKFVIAYGGKASIPKTAISDMNDTSAFEADFEKQLTAQPATLTVYDDSNNKIAETTLTLADLDAAGLTFGTF